MTKTATNLIVLAKDCRRIVDRARADLGDDLRGFSIVDLVADNLPSTSLSDISAALVVAGLTDGVDPDQADIEQEIRDARGAESWGSRPGISDNCIFRASAAAPGRLRDV